MFIATDTDSTEVVRGEDGSGSPQTQTEVTVVSSGDSGPRLRSWRASRRHRRWIRQSTPQRTAAVASARWGVAAAARVILYGNREQPSAASKWM